MSLKKIQTENQNETKEIFLKNEREKWDFIISQIPQRIIRRQKMKIKKMKKNKTTKKKWELKMKTKEPLQCWIVNIMSSTNPFY